MDIHARQLVRLAELLNVSAGVLRDLLEVRDFDGESATLDEAADQLDSLAKSINQVGRSGLPRPT